MKWFLIAVLLTVSQAPPPTPRQTTDSAASTSGNIESQTKADQKQAAPPESAVHTGESPQNEAPRNEQAPNNAQHSIIISKLPTVTVLAPKRDWVDWGYWVFSGLLVVAGALQIWLPRKTYHAISGQAGIMRQQEVVMAGQLSQMTAQVTEMSKQTELIGASVSVAKESADAARDNIELFISRERARLSVEIGDFTASRDKSKMLIMYFVCHRGPTDATVTGSKIEAYVSKTLAPSDSKTYFEMSVPNLITPETKLPGQFVAVSSPLRDEEKEALVTGELILHLCGYIEYADIFGRNRRTKFRFVWNPPPVPTMRGTWEKCGPSYENEAT